MCATKYLQVAKKYVEMCNKSKNFMQFAGGLRPISVSEGRVKVEFEVTPAMTNPWGGLHGGCTATLVDVVTTLACLVTPRGKPGVSVDLHVTYLAAIREGDTVIMDAEVIKAGKTLAFTRADVILKEGNRIAATGLHTKAFPPEK
uniref:Acyl-coenzyme A thioesterase 13 n=1 Tax=Haemonchus contortus TaxID=6289 RepID=A0A7I5E6Z7_HAECO|nr:Thioesterase superfamily domain containing protein [Haemonchus contortus]